MRQVVISERRDYNLVSSAFSTVRKYLSAFNDVLLESDDMSLESNIDSLNNQRFDGACYVFPYDKSEAKRNMDMFFEGDANSSAWFCSEENKIYINDDEWLEMFDWIKDATGGRRVRLINKLTELMRESGTLIHETIHFIDIKHEPEGEFNVKEELTEYVNSYWEVNAFFIEALYQTIKALKGKSVDNFYEFKDILYSMLEDTFKDNMSEDTRRAIIKRMWVFYDKHYL